MKHDSGDIDSPHNSNQEDLDHHTSKDKQYFEIIVNLDMEIQAQSLWINYFQKITQEHTTVRSLPQPLRYNYNYNPPKTTYLFQPSTNHWKYQDNNLSSSSESYNDSITQLPNTRLVSDSQKPTHKSSQLALCKGLFGLHIRRGMDRPRKYKTWQEKENGNNISWRKSNYKSRNKPAQMTHKTRNLNNSNTNCHN